MALSYLDSCMKYDIEAIDELTWWWRVRHPLRWHAVRVRRVYALDLLDESGK